MQHTPRVASATKWRPTRTNPIYYSSITFSYLLRHWPRLPHPPSFSCYSTLADAKCVLLDELSVRLCMCASGCVCVWHVYPVVCSLERTLTCPTPARETSFLASRFNFKLLSLPFFYDKLHLATTDANASTIATPHPPPHHVDCHTTTLSLKGFRFSQELGWGSR